MPVYTYTTLDDPSAVGGATHALGINSTGQIVGYYTDAINRGSGFLYSNGTYTTLIDPSATGDTVASGINDAGQIVGNYIGGLTTKQHGFFYSGGIFTNLDDPLGIGGSANGIRSSGITLTAGTSTASSRFSTPRARTATPPSTIP